MAQPTRYVLTSQDTDINHVMNNPMNLALMLKQAFLNVPTRTSSLMSTSAAGIGSSGKVFLGVSIELPGLPLDHSIHAEQFLIANLSLNSERQLTHLALSPDGYNFNSPCSYCRQFLNEIQEASSIKILIKDTSMNEAGRFETLETLLPRRSSFIHPLLLEPRDNKLTLLYPEYVGVTCADHERCNHLKCKALAAANRSFSPYTKNPSGVALLDKLGNVYRGWYMETVTYGLSLGPVQAALVDFVARGGTEFDTIVQAVLVEKKYALVSQEKTTRMILKKISNGNCVINVFHCGLPVDEQLKIVMKDIAKGGF
ncbi:hypothetical protein N665_0593s0020 [Sinapis alba]|nr:hypothetical protein N665_0593s0020 [Sinapis alba]